MYVYIYLHIHKSEPEDINFNELFSSCNKNAMTIDKFEIEIKIEQQVSTCG